MTTNILTINNLEIILFLGWPNEERMRKQVVSLDIKMQFPNSPKACVSDHLDDTVCYRKLIENLRDHIGQKKFHLIEHVTQEMYDFIKTQIPAATKLQVHLTKRPQIDGLGSVTYVRSS